MKTIVTLVVVALGAHGLDISTSSTGQGMCGIGTNMLDSNDAAMAAFCTSGLEFWWNWGHTPQKSTYSGSDCAAEKFISMFWGMSKDDQYIARDNASKFSHVMGYNEPDHWGPPPIPGGDTMSSGTSPDYFHCANPDLASHWQQIVINYKRANPNGIVVSPAPADAANGGMGAASAGDSSKCGSSPQTNSSHMDDCAGWLKCFKDVVINLRCGETNCWDAISVIQFHAYFYEASDFIDKVKLWEAAWADDLQGLNGRSKKTLWITEFCHAGTTDPSDPNGAGRAFIDETLHYLKASPYVSGWSWFSQDNTSFATFPIMGVEPKTPFWDSSLISKTGEVTALGQHYFDKCSDSSTMVV